MLPKTRFLDLRNSKMFAEFSILFTTKAADISVDNTVTMSQSHNRSFKKMFDIEKRLRAQNTFLPNTVRVLPPCDGDGSTIVSAGHPLLAPANFAVDDSLKSKKTNDCCLRVSDDGSKKQLKSGSKHLPRQTTFRWTVSFAPASENKIYEIPHIHDYSPAMISSIWYDDTEYDHIQISCTKIIEKMNSVKPTERIKKRYCSRGLEHFTKGRAETRRTIRLLAADAVLNEQFSQWEKGVLEPAAGIADIYIKHCLKSKIDAIITARRDELESTHVVHRKKKIDTCIKNSQMDEHELKVHDHAPLEVHHTTPLANLNAPPQA
jgi:hypothetical protein